MRFVCAAILAPLLLMSVLAAGTPVADADTCQQAHTPSPDRCSTRAMASSAADIGTPASTRDAIVLGGGCFWCLEACYQLLKGVESVVSGYAGGHVVNPTYEQVCGKKTGHAEVVKVTFDPATITLEDILLAFFVMHDPTTKDQQGNDVGPQYRSIILYNSEAQKAVAEKVMQQVAADKLWGSAPIVTELKPLGVLYPAEGYHQNYYNENPSQPYCQFVVAPKVSKFRSSVLKRLMA